MIFEAKQIEESLAHQYYIWKFKILKRPSDYSFVIVVVAITVADTSMRDK